MYTFKIEVLMSPNIYDIKYSKYGSNHFKFTFEMRCENFILQDNAYEFRARTSSVPDARVIFAVENTLF